ncbi:MAG: VacJ family lipoprotein [Betaproteobacteria bacterium]|jgi:phospholipid-binding lipoprotein MlaA|nr:VacJ family lipoprotein [Betaproteobacteria bacterium]
MNNMLRRFVLLTALMAAAGCAHLPAGHISDPRDPWERYNRTVFEFNDSLDRAVIKPVAEAYRDYVPELAQRSLRNVFSNLRDVIITAHQLLQGKPQAAMTAGSRVLINSTIGALGLGDPASEMGLIKTNEDFGQTFGRWGIGPGPYFVLPLLGPSTVRDTIGTVADFNFDPIGSVFEQGTGRNIVYGLIAIDRRKDLLDAQDTIEALSFDRYSGVRDAWLARRRSLVYDGEPPPPKIKED